MRILLVAAVTAWVLMSVSVAEEPMKTKAEIWKQIQPLFSPPEQLKNDFGNYPTVLKFNDGRPVTNAAEWQVRRQEILKTWHDAMGPWPALIPSPAIRYLSKEHVETFTRHKVEIEVAPNRRTIAWLLIPDGQGPFPAVLTVFYGPEDAAGLNPEKRLQHDFGYQLIRRGFVSLNIGDPGSTYPNDKEAQLQPLSYMGYVAANCSNLLAGLPEVDGARIGVVGHSFGGKWAMFGSCLYDKFACACWCDPGIVWDEKRPNVNYWERWYLGYEKGNQRKEGVPRADNPRTGAYKLLYESGHDLNELHALMAPRPFLVSGGSEDQPERWQALNRTVEVNRLLGHENRVAMSNRPGHTPTPEAMEQICLFFQYFLQVGE